MALIVRGSVYPNDTGLYSGNAGRPLGTRTTNDELRMTTMHQLAALHEEGSGIALQWRMLLKSARACHDSEQSSAVRMVGGAQGGNKIMTVAGREEQTEDWNIRAVMRGDGSTAYCGRRFRSGAYYASGSLTGGAETYHEIEINSLVLCDQGASILEWQCIPITDEAKVKMAITEVKCPSVDLRICTESSTVHQLRNAVRKWCDKNMGFAIVVGGPGARQPSKRLKNYYRNCKTSFLYRSGSRRCLESAFINGLLRLFGSQVSINAANLNFDEEGCTSSVRRSNVRLGALQSMIHSVNKVSSRKLESRKVCKRDRNEFRACEFRWLCEQARGVWVVRLVQDGIVDHCVLVDTYEALIFDCAEDHPIALTEEALRWCAGDDASNPRVAEVRQLVEQRSKKRKHRK